jgi:tetratricopeptide (TPR) repeat protein
VADLRAEAALYARLTTRQDRLRLIELLEEIGGKVSLEAADRFRLARLYEATGNWAKSRELLEELLKQHPEDGLLTAQYAQVLLRSGSVEAARSPIDRVAALMPDSFVVVLLRCRLLAADKRQPEAVPLVLEFLEQRKQAPSAGESLRDLVAQNNHEEAFTVLEQHLRQQRDAAGSQALAEGRKLIAEGQIDAAVNRLRDYLRREDLRQVVDAFYQKAAARLLAELDQHGAAESVYREYLKSSTTPEDVLTLAVYVTRQGRVDEALDLCEQAWETCEPVAVAHSCVAILRESQATPAQIARVEAWLLRAVEKASDLSRLLLRLADLRDYQGRYDQAEAVYRQILARNPENPTALNNLAWLMALRGVRPGDDPRGYIDQAIRVHGPGAELLDTRAVVLLARGDANGAIAELKRALDESASDRFYFHLAQAQAAKGDREAARRSLEEARSAGFKESSLHPLERPGYERLLEQLEGTPTARR